MTVFDDVMVGIGRGMNAADRKAQELKIQAEISEVQKQQSDALLALGTAVYAGEGPDSDLLAKYSEQAREIVAAEEKAAELQAQLDALRAPVQPTYVTQPAGTPLVSCPACGASVAINAVACPACGDNLAAVKSGFRVCTACNAYYKDDAVFCECCGARLEELPVVETPVSDVSAGPKCAQCGAELDEDALFCSNCGARVEVPVPAPDPVVDSSPAVESAQEVEVPATEPVATTELEPEAEPALEVVPQPEVAPVSAPVSAPTFEPARAVNVCVSCGAPLVEGARFCGECGAQQLQPTVVQPKPAMAFCPSCGSPAIPGAFFCGECGSRLG